MPPADSPAAGPPPSIEEQTGMLTDGDGKISPATFPVPTPSPGHIETLASRLRTSGGAVSDVGHDINSSWGGLTGCYQAPEAAELYTVLNPVAPTGTPSRQPERRRQRAGGLRRRAQRHPVALGEAAR
ncbi:hypothetical protein BJF83_19730 [Nocardiopsis sp. CNR-923]|uniref:hypothetical protein n=1 Tax=Nocardiopsis sp. CNR-923 TaxID=1904965 RepID=UPI0009616534|nr:hypothetical protein [Nocardiopsis sp. CNR-923]OLT27011.1 hypothetical protein BJF83_19730 [Nocardiopsis sp. CNR-923]